VTILGHGDVHTEKEKGEEGGDEDKGGILQGMSRREI
jgi:hypothetical protein